MKHAIARAVLAAATAAGAAGSVAAAIQTSPPAPSTAASGTPGQAPPNADAAFADAAFADAIKGLQRSRGLFTMYRSADDSRVLMEIAEDQLDTMFLLAATMERGVGERGIYASQFMVDHPFVLRRTGNAVQMVRLNTRFTAAEGTPQARGVERSFTDAIIGQAKIVAGPRPPRRSVLVDAAELFAADLPGLSQTLSRAYEPTAYRFDRGGSGIAAIRNFPDNTLLHVRLHFTTDNPRVSSLTLPDRRSVPLTVAYDLFRVRQTTYRPRQADDRVGHFFAVQQDFTSDQPSTTYRRSIARWHLEKADPSASLSPPKQPIVFWLENTVPVAYRPYFTEGVLVWNKAFERIGFRDAIEVRQQPEDPSWDAADVRYSTIRWFASADVSGAIGPIRGNPFTGEIYDADVSISDGIIRGAHGALEEVFSPVLPPPGATHASGFGSPTAALDCHYANGLAEQAAFGLEVLQARRVEPELRERLMREYLVNLVAHEVGHALGLRHNFRGSTALSLADVHDMAKTTLEGQSGSVMDYSPVVIASRGTPQGHFLPVTLGAYDYWSIEYAYKVIDGDEGAELRAMASRAAERGLAYATDEDAGGQNPAAAIDPLVNQYDQSGDPIAFFRERVGQIHEVWRSMETRLVRAGEGFQILRRSINRSMADYGRALLTASKAVGGIYHNRSHADDPGGALPFTAVPAERQREALQFLREFAFGERAFRLPLTLHRKLAVERLRGVDVEAYTASTQRINYPYHDVVLELQRRVLSQLLHPATLSRVQDGELLVGRGQEPFTLAELFHHLYASIWSELSKAPRSIPTVRRNVQQEHLRQLTRLILEQPDPPRPRPGQPIPIDQAPFRTPDDARSLALATLRQIQRRSRAALTSGVPDPTTRAHLEGLDARVEAVLRGQAGGEIDR